MGSMFDQVSEWDEATGGDASEELRWKVMAEEWQELVDAREEDDLVEIADACADLIWTVLLYAKGRQIPFDAVWSEVLRSNRAKILPDGTVLRREDGKILKPPGWTPPDIQAALSGSVRAEFTTHDCPDLNCHECYACYSRYVEMKMAGQLD